MPSVRSIGAVLGLLILAGCASPAGTLYQAMGACSKGAGQVEIRATGTVLRLLGTRRTYSGLHEGFVAGFPMSANGRPHATWGPALRIEDNADITGRIPLHAGEPIVLQGEYACDDSVIHWTHHDPRMRHIGGFIQAGGRTYE